MNFETKWRQVGVEAGRELVGSALYVWVACAGMSGGVQTAAAALATGFTAAAVSYSCGSVMNPMLTLVKFASGRTSAVQALVNVVSQFMGAVIAAAVVALGAGAHGLGGNALPLGSNWRASLVSEAAAGAMVVFVYMGANADSSPIVLGMGTVAASVATSTASSVALNPFRALAPAMVSGVWGEAFWTFVAGPALGAFVGAGVHLSLDLAETTGGPQDPQDPQDPRDMDAALRRFRAAERNYV
jgi:aquaporin Z